MKRTSSSLAILFVGFFLAACNTADHYTTPEGTVSVGSSFSANSSADLSTQGVPYDPETGESGVTSGVLKVFESDPTADCILGFQSDELFFSADGDVVQESEAVPQTLSTDDPTATLSLPPGSYTFVVEAEDDLAVGLLCDVDVAGGDEVIVPLTSYIGDVELSVPEEVVPNGVFDVFYQVSPPGRPDLRVPASDYGVAEFSAESEDGDVTVLGRSNVGFRVAAECAQIDVNVRIVPNTPDLETIRGSPNLGFRVATNIPPSAVCEGTSAGADLVPPSISVDSTAEDGSLFLQGEVSDAQSGIDRVEIYDGPVLISQPELTTSDAISTWLLEIDLLSLSSDQLVVFVYDNAGNENRAAIEVPAAQ